MKCYSNTFNDVIAPPNDICEELECGFWDPLGWRCSGEKSTAPYIDAADIYNVEERKRISIESWLHKPSYCCCQHHFNDCHSICVCAMNGNKIIALCHSQKLESMIFRFFFIHHTHVKSWSGCDFTYNSNDEDIWIFFAHPQSLSYTTVYNMRII